MDRAEAESFLYLEARLIDERRFEEWLELFTEDGVYWLPTDDTAAAGDQLSLVHDDALRRSERVYRLRHGALAQSPPSRTLHLVSNVEVSPGAGPDETTVRSAQLIAEMRTGDDRQLELGEQRTFAAHCEHRLRREAPGWRIACKRMVLLNRDIPIPNLTFIL